VARLGRGHPGRPPVIRPRRGVRPASIPLPAWETVPEWPPTQVIVPDARIRLPTWETIPEWPAQDIKRHQYVRVPAWETVPEWPEPEVTVPRRPGDSLTGEPGQVELNGLLMGTGTSYRIAEITGWRSLPEVDDLAVLKPSQHGAWSGRRLAKQRLVTLRIRIDSISDPTQIDSLLDDLDQVTGLGVDDTPIPLVVKGYGEPQLAYGVVIDRNIPLNSDYSNGSPTCSILIACRDPRRLSIRQHGVTIPKGVPTALANTGNAASHPILRIHGPAEDPTLVNASTSRTLAYSATVPDGKTLLVDTANGLATLDGGNVLPNLSGGGVPPSEFVLAPGINEITYTTTSGGEQGVDVLWRDSSH